MIIEESPWVEIARERPGECWCYYNGPTTPEIPWCDLHRCNARTVRGTRCGNHARFGGLCRIHYEIAERDINRVMGRRTLQAA